MGFNSVAQYDITLFFWNLQIRYFQAGAQTERVRIPFGVAWHKPMLRGEKVSNLCPESERTARAKCTKERLEKMKKLITASFWSMDIVLNKFFENKLNLSASRSVGMFFENTV